MLQSLVEIIPKTKNREFVFSGTWFSLNMGLGFNIGNGFSIIILIEIYAI